MRVFYLFSVLTLLAANAWAATIINPDEATVWEAASAGQFVAWTSVPTDPPSFTLNLTNLQIIPNINIMLKQNVSTAAGNTTVGAPSFGWPTGIGFQINIVQENSTNVLVQSQPFDIIGTTVLSSSSLPQSSTSTGTSPESTGSGKNGDSGLTVPTGFAVGLTLVCALLA